MYCPQAKLEVVTEKAEMLNEDLLQFVWQHRLLKPQPLTTVSGLPLEILHPGTLNRDAGPDFFNARLRINGLTLAGNVELHLKSSDWLKHQHQHNPSYDNIILHVVHEHDVNIPQNDKHNVEVLQLKTLIPPRLSEQYGKLLASKEQIPCARQLPEVDEVKFSLWLQRMFVERLERKTEQIRTLWQSLQGDYASTFFILLVRNFGFKVNALPFELLARQLPVTLLLKHADDLLQLEALLLGTAGMLQEPFSHTYARRLQNEAEHLLSKYRIVPLKKELFKFSRMRPANFPGLRLAQLAMLIHQRPGLFSAPQQYDAYDRIDAALSINLESYWKNHYQLDGKSTEADLQFGQLSRQNVMINTFAPFLFFYLKQNGRSNFHQIPFEILLQCHFEDNAKTRLFRSRRHNLHSAADSQALLHLHDHYCSSRQCLRCGVAAAILK